MDAASLFSSANSLYVCEEYEEALKHYTCAVTLQDCAEYRSCRAAVHLKLGKFAEAIDDAAEALRLDPRSHMALHWRGISLFYQGNFADAKAAFEESMRACPGARAPRGLWVRKCDAELSGSTLPLGGVAAEISKAAPAQVQSTAAMPKPVAEELEVPAESHIASASSGGGQKTIKREWYQNTTHVIVTVFAKGVEEDVCKADFKDRAFSLAFPIPGTTDEDYQLDMDLFDAVVPSNCKMQVSKVKIELSLAKKNAGLHWKDLEKGEEAPYAPDHPSYPSSNKQKRDWNQIDRDIDSELKAEKPQGDEALNKLFREIYDRADDETRRAMNKSFQTSGGTVLSTNWGEVARSDYEGKDRPSPPDGQAWKDWRQK